MLNNEAGARQPTRAPLCIARPSELALVMHRIVCHTYSGVNSASYSAVGLGLTVCHTVVHLGEFSTKALYHLPPHLEG